MQRGERNSERGATGTKDIGTLQVPMISSQRNSPFSRLISLERYGISFGKVVTTVQILIVRMKIQSSVGTGNTSQHPRMYISSSVLWYFQLFSSE
jgi:hypothetical protein